MKRLETMVIVTAAALAGALVIAGSPRDARAEEPATTVISQKGKVFAPTEITVAKGQSVTFRNDDPITHNVFSRTKGSQFNLKMQKPGQEDVVTFEEPGDVVVRCAIHPTMKLTVHVEDAEKLADAEN